MVSRAESGRPLHLRRATFRSTIHGVPRPLTARGRGGGLARRPPRSPRSLRVSRLGRAPLGAAVGEARYKVCRGGREPWRGVMGRAVIGVHCHTAGRGCRARTATTTPGLPDRGAVGDGAVARSGVARPGPPSITQLAATPRHLTGFELRDAPERSPGPAAARPRGSSFWKTILLPLRTGRDGPDLPSAGPCPAVRERQRGVGGQVGTIAVPRPGLAASAATLRAGPASPAPLQLATAPARRGPAVMLALLGPGGPLPPARSGGSTAGPAILLLPPAIHIHCTLGAALPHSAMLCATPINIFFSLPGSCQACGARRSGTSRREREGRAARESRGRAQGGSGHTGHQDRPDRARGPPGTRSTRGT